MASHEDNRTPVQPRSERLHWTVKLCIVVLVAWVAIVGAVALVHGWEDAVGLACCGSIAPLLLFAVLGKISEKQEKENALPGEFDSAKKAHREASERAEKLAAKLREKSYPQCWRCRAKLDKMDASFCPRCGQRLL